MGFGERQAEGKAEGQGFEVNDLRDER